MRQSFGFEHQQLKQIFVRLTTQPAAWLERAQ
jgi:hypothetical protein